MGSWEPRANIVPKGTRGASAVANEKAENGGITFSYIGGRKNEKYNNSIINQSSFNDAFLRSYKLSLCQPLT